jgi:lipid-A-disaccharide synthase
MMLEAMKDFPEYQPVIAGAPGIEKAFYEPYLKEGACIVFGQTYNILNNSHAALVTSGTATLETAIFGVPQVVCYATPMPKLYSWLRKKFLKVKYISLVNLIADREVVTELVADTMRPDCLDAEVKKLLEQDSDYRNLMFKEYDRVISILGEAGASRSAAQAIYKVLKASKR